MLCKETLVTRTFLQTLITLIALGGYGFVGTLPKATAASSSIAAPQKIAQLDEDSIHSDVSGMSVDSHVPFRPMPAIETPSSGDRSAGDASSHRGSQQSGPFAILDSIAIELFSQSVMLAPKSPPFVRSGDPSGMFEPPRQSARR